RPGSARPGGRRDGPGVSPLVGRGAREHVGVADLHAHVHGDGGERLAAVDNSGAESGTRVAAASIPNVFGGGEMTLIVDPRLVGSYDDYCYYHDTTRGPKPIIGYELVAPRPVEQTQLDHEGRFLNGELRFSVEAYVVFAIGDWHTSYAIIL
ncbi:MAG: hypothetical protein ACE5EV_08890, partial [Gaiellales bacterium]